jgi:hypothetical protein
VAIPDFMRGLHHLGVEVTNNAGRDWFHFRRCAFGGERGRFPWRDRPRGRRRDSSRARMVRSFYRNAVLPEPGLETRPITEVP